MAFELSVALYRAGTCQATMQPLNNTNAGSGRASARRGAVNFDRARLRPARVRNAGGSARHILGHGPPSRINGGATVSSSTCWIMCAQNSLSAAPSIGESSASTIVRSPAMNEAVRSGSCLTLRPRPHSQNRSPAAATYASGGSIDQPASSIALQQVEDHERDHADEDVVRPKERAGLKAGRHQLELTRRDPLAPRPGLALATPSPNARDLRLDPVQARKHEHRVEHGPADVNARIAAACGTEAQRGPLGHLKHHCKQPEQHRAEPKRQALERSLRAEPEQHRTEHQGAGNRDSETDRGADVMADLPVVVQ